MVARTHGSKMNKKRVLQNRVAQKMTEADPSLEPGDLMGRQGAAGGEDIVMSPLGRRVFPWSVECKNQEKLQPKQWWLQCAGTCAKESALCKKDLMPVLVVRFPPMKGLQYGGDFAMVKLDDLIALQIAANRGKE